MWAVPCYLRSSRWPRRNRLACCQLGERGVEEGIAAIEHDVAGQVGAALVGLGAQAHQQVRLAGDGVADQGQRLAFVDHSQVARVWMVAGLMFGLASKSKSLSHFCRVTWNQRAAVKPFPPSPSAL